ncbi:carbohydrate porin [Nannocystis sp.]|uniref:carbohydrate porin n=1 Tax=Nannocystis sp. TaxID=1962667 RepID=UPI0025E404AE|nr:carbohydrate porin [Nannocystis sp.]MBK7825790.1 carbohydrate porin [Nannocystis sp.]
MRRDPRRVPAASNVLVVGALASGLGLAAPALAASSSPTTVPRAALAGPAVPAAAPAPSPLPPPPSSQPTASQPPITDPSADPGDSGDASAPAPSETPAPTSAIPSTAAVAVPRATDESAKPAGATADPPPPPSDPHDPNQPPGYANGFHFGSYGRVIAAGDAAGRPGRDADIVSRGSRLDESNYAELELRREDYWKKTGAYTRIVATTAFANPVFHYNGQFAASIALRNLYLEETGLGAKGLSVWAGSRMYRGDDIYLLNFWPLDNLNTIGGGLGYAFGEARRTSLKFHAGLNQPTDPYYRQTVLRAPPQNQFGETEVAILDRQKLISSLKLTHTWPLGEAGGVKGILYGEFHYVPDGQREVESKVYEALPKDFGFVAGGQVTAFTGKRSTYLTVTGRFAQGLAAYGELNAPTQLRPNRRTTGAHELIVTLSGNWEKGPVGVMFGGYYRQFRNASKQLDFDDVNEGIVIARPTVWFGQLAGLSLEGSYQMQQRGVLQEIDTNTFKPVIAGLGRVGIIPFITPGGAGGFQRPHIRFIYALTVRDAGARSFYAADDVFSRRSVDHFIGMGAEWWFGSTSYFRD